MNSLFLLLWLADIADSLRQLDVVVIIVGIFILFWLGVYSFAILCKDIQGEYPVKSTILVVSLMIGSLVVSGLTPSRSTILSMTQSIPTVDNTGDTK